MKKRYYSKSEIIEILNTETDSMRPVDIENLAKIFTYLNFSELKRVSKAVIIVSKGGD